MPSVPDKGGKMVSYSGCYSSVSRGKRTKNDRDYLLPFILKPGGSSRKSRKNLARLIQKIYEIDPTDMPEVLSA